MFFVNSNSIYCDKIIILLYICYGKIFESIGLKW